MPARLTGFGVTRFSFQFCIQTQQTQLGRFVGESLAQVLQGHFHKPFVAKLTSGSLNSELSLSSVFIDYRPLWSPRNTADNDTTERKFRLIFAGFK